MARCMTTAGVRPGMVVHNANGYGLFTGGMGFHQGAERLGATIVPVSGGFTARQVVMLRDLGGEVLVSTPSYALTIAAAIREAGIDPATLPLKLGLFGGEPWTERMREQLDRELDFRAVNFFGLSEMCGPGVAVECVEQRHGLHVNEDHFLVEVIDPEDGRVLEPGAEGELVFTTLTKEALPLIRYRTSDIGRLTHRAVSVRAHDRRLLGLRGRIDDMVVIRGVNVYPSNVEHLLLGVEGIAPSLPADGRATRRPGRADARVRGRRGDRRGRARAMAERIVALLREHMGLRITVLVLVPGSLPRSEGKAIRLVDRRPNVLEPARRRRPAGIWVPTCAMCLTSLGVTPNRRLKTREKWAVSQKPQRKAISVTEPALRLLQVLQAALQSLVADDHRDRLVTVLEQRVQRSHRHRERARDRRRSEVRVLEVVADMAADLGAQGGTLRRPTGRQLRLDDGAQQLERNIRR